jgi:hypothetical protein
MTPISSKSSPFLASLLEGFEDDGVDDELASWSSLIPKSHDDAGVGFSDGLPVPSKQESVKTEAQLTSVLVWHRRRSIPSRIYVPLQYRGKV